MFHFAKVNIELAKILHPSRNTVKHPKRPKFASKQSHIKSLKLLRFAERLPVQYLGSELCFRSLRVPTAVEQREDCLCFGTIEQPLCGIVNEFHNPVQTRGKDRIL